MQGRRAHLITAVTTLGEISKQCRRFRRPIDPLASPGGLASPFIDLHPKCDDQAYLVRAVHPQQAPSGERGCCRNELLLVMSALSVHG